MSWGKRRHQRLVDAVLDGRCYLHPLNVIWELVWCIPFVFFPLLPIGYILVGRVFMAKLMFADPSCRGCGSCARNCPARAIAMRGGNQKMPFWTHRCEVCMRCMGYCELKSVQTSHLWVVPVAFAASLLTTARIQEYLEALIGQSVSLPGAVFELISLVLSFFALLLVYYLFFGLQQLRPLRLLFTYTTFTKLFPRRYHAPGVRAREMRRKAVKK
jgi:ferredoxin